MEKKEAKIQIRCARVGLEVYLDSTEQYLTGYEAFSDMSGQRNEREYSVCWRMQERHLGHRLLLSGKGFQREVLLNEDLLDQGEPDIFIDLLEGRLVKAINRRELIMSCDPAGALDFLYQEIGNLKVTAPAYHNAWEQLMLAGSSEFSAGIWKIRSFIRELQMRESFDTYSREFFQRYGYPEGVKEQYQETVLEKAKEKIPEKVPEKTVAVPAKKTVSSTVSAPVSLPVEEGDDSDLDAQIEVINDHIRTAASESPFRIKEIFHEFGSGPQNYEETDKIIKRTEAYLNGRRD